MPDRELQNLRAARRRVCANLRKLEPILAGYRAKLAAIEARMQELDPRLWLPPRQYQANPVFARRELPRLAMEIMRAEGEPLPVAVIARRCLAAKGVDRPAPRLVMLTKNRLHNLLLKWDARGLTVKVGRGLGTRRGLAGSH